MSSGDIKVVVRKCQEIIKQKDGTGKIKVLLEMCGKNDFVKWKDDQNLDILHHCIVENNPEVAEYLLISGYFNEPFEPESNPYSHLAARLGRRTILGLIMSHRLNDIRPRVSSLLTYPDVFTLGKTDYTIKGSEVTPLDVAALSGHVQCVHMILNQCIIKEHPDHAKDGYISLSTLANSHLSVKLLLQGKHDTKDLLKAVEIAISQARPECLDRILATGIDVKPLFQGANLFHALYTYSSAKAFGREGYKRLPEVTAVLIQRKHNVNAKAPNTYPLYSLLRNSLCCHDYINTGYYLDCLRQLLKAGANPYFDEVKYEALIKKKGQKSLTGRPAFSSALQCLLDTVEIYASYFDSNALAVKFITECSDILLGSEAKNGDKGSTMAASVLHYYAKSSVSLGVSSEVLKFFLRQGANPNSQVNGKYMLNTFCDVLFRRLLEVPKYKQQTSRMKDLEAMLEVCYFMTWKTQRDTLQIFMKDYGNNKSEQIKDYITRVKQCLDGHVTTVAPLKRMCVNFIWQQCGRSANKIHALPINVKLRTDILPIL